jgi:hypothetical protein
MAASIDEEPIAFHSASSEDWGWFIEYSTDDGNEYRLCCANSDRAWDMWRCCLDPKANSVLGWKRAPVEGAGQPIRALRDLLATEQGIINVTWE